MNNKRLSKNNYDDDYAKIKPGYAGNRPTDNANNADGGFTNVIKQDKDDARSKALDAQTRYKMELDAQLKAKRNSICSEGQDRSPQKRQKSPVKSSPVEDQYDSQSQYGNQSNNPYAEGSQYSPYKEGAGGERSVNSRSGFKQSNLTEEELVRLSEQKRKQQEMIDYLQQQIADKHAKKNEEKNERIDHGRQLQQDSQSSRDGEKDVKWREKERQKEYASDLGVQIQKQQQHKKTSLW